MDPLRKLNQLLALVDAADGWTALPALADRSSGTTVMVYSPAQKTAKVKIHDELLTDQQVDTFHNKLERLGFSFGDAKGQQKASRREKAALDRRELEEQEAATRAAISKVVGVREENPAAPPPTVALSLGYYDVTPEYAQELLDAPGWKAQHRPIYRRNVGRFIAYIKNDEWTADFMGIDWYGFVVQGRHRLTAIVESGRTVRCLLGFGFDPAFFTVKDTPLRQTAGDQIFADYDLPEDVAMHNRKLSSGLRVLIDYKDGCSAGSYGRESIENKEMSRLFGHYLGLVEAFLVARPLFERGKPGKVVYQPGPSIAFCYLALEAWPECGEYLAEYVQSLAHGTNIGVDDPRGALRNFLISKREGQRGTVKNVRSVHLFALLIKTWNETMMGMPRQTAYWRLEEGVPDPLTADMSILENA